MENASRVSSEEELLKLREEGKISQAEYNDLLGAMGKQLAVGTEVRTLEHSIQDSKRKLGRIAFYLMLAGIVVPIMAFLICFAIAAGGEGDVIFSVCLFLCVLAEIPAFVIGVISWPNVLGKATVITIAIVTVITLLLMS
jgi:hypothetical protein